MPVCHACHKDYPAGTSTCPHCGVAARPSTGGSATKAFGSSPPSAGHLATAAAPAPQPTPPPVSGSPGAVQMSDLPPGMVVSDYKIEHKLGEGGMGAVYAAVHPLIGKKAAIKVISPQLCTDASSVERFVQEARSVNQIGHPNIVDIFTFGVLPDGRSYFVMEWLQGESLADRLARGGMTLGEAVEIMDQVADALEAAHEKGIVHRDLKPDNTYLVKVRGDRRLVKLLDFGIAKLAGGDVRVQKTATGMMMGTPGYISPEQARGKNVDNRTDVYAFGCMAYEMVLGRLPFVAESAMDVVLKHLTEPPPPPSSIWPEIPPQLEDILLRMLDKDPARRPSLHEFRAVLAEMRGMIASTMGPAGAGAFPSGFGPRPVTPGQPVRMATPAPGSMSVATQNARPAVRTPAAQPAPDAAMIAAAEADVAAAAAPRKGGKGKIIGLALGLVAVAGAGGVIAMSGGKTQEPAAAAATGPAPTPPQAPEQTPPPEQKPPEQKPPEPVPPPAPTTGTLVVSVAGASDAVIELDGKKIGTGASVTIDVAEGDHKLLVTAPGKKPVEKTVTIAAGARAEVPVALESEKKSGGKKPPGGDGGKKPPGGDGGKPPPPGDSNYTIDPFTGQKVKK
jgi:serine/threonine-protein kinase